jgi:hypothetical protein
MLSGRSKSSILRHGRFALEHNDTAVENYNSFSAKFQGVAYAGWSGMMQLNFHKSCGRAEERSFPFNTFSTEVNSAGLGSGPYTRFHRSSTNCGNYVTVADSRGSIIAPRSGFVTSNAEGQETAIDTAKGRLIASVGDMFAVRV